MITKRIVSLTAALLLILQLVLPFAPVVYAETEQGEEAGFATSETAETAKQSAKLAGKENSSKNIQLLNNNAAVDFFAAIDGEWEQVGSIENPLGPENLGGSNRYYLTAKQLEEIYAPFGFSASSFDGELYFPHTDDYNRQTMWADAAPQGTGIDAKIPISFRNKSYVYYLPNNTEDKDGYFTTNKSITDTQTINNNLFYSVSFEDAASVLDSVPPDTMYVKANEDIAINLPISEEYSWECRNKNTSEKIVPEEEIHNGIATYTIPSVSAPLVFETHNNGISFSYNPSAKSSITRVGHFNADLQSIITDATIKGKDWYTQPYKGDTYTILGPDVTKVLVALPSNMSTGAKLYYSFVGWKVGATDTILTEGTVLTKEEIDALEATDDVVSLQAIWTATSNDSNQRATSLNFYVNKDCEIMDSMSNGFKSQHANLFSSSVCTTRVMNADNVPKTDNGSIQLLAPPTTEDTAYETDTQLRNAATGSLPYGIQIEAFPSDEEVLAELREEQKDATHKISLNGEVVNAEDITSDNFTVRWYVLKYESADGWHVDGVLVAKHAKIVVQKTFAGDNEAISEIENGSFNITIQHEEGGIEKTDYTLTLSKTSADGMTSYTSYDATTRTYLWVLPVAQGVKYTVKEHNYMPQDTDKWHTDTRWGISKGGSTSWQNYLSENGATIVAEAYPEDVPESAYAKVRLENTYVKAGTLRIHKIDSYTGNGMQSISFILARVDDKALTIYKKQGTSEYTTAANGVDLGYTETAARNLLTTDANGDIYVSLEVDADETLSGEYFLEEITPEGYKDIPKLRIKVTDNGIIKFAHSAVDGSDLTDIIEGANTSTLTIKNTCAYSATVIAKKTWGDSIKEHQPVTVELWMNGQKIANCTGILSSENNWQISWNDMPLFVDGKPAKYRIRETKIGDTYADSAGKFKSFTVTYSKAIYKARNSEEHDSMQWTASGQTIYADTAILEVVNTQPEEPVRVTIKKHVTGSMGDRKRPFTFTAYAVKDGAIQSYTLGNTVTQGKQEFTLQDEQIVTVLLPRGSTLYVTENSYAGYKTSYAIDDNTRISGKNVELQAENDSTIIAFYNDKEAIPDVGIKDQRNWPYYVILALTSLLLVVLAYRKKRSLEGDEDN